MSDNKVINGEVVKEEVVKRGETLKEFVKSHKKVIAGAAIISLGVLAALGGKRLNPETINRAKEAFDKNVTE